MQIFQWLFKLANEQDREAGSAPSNRKTYPKDMFPFRTSIESKRRKERNQSGTNKSFRPSKLLWRRDVAEACFYSTLCLTRLSSSTVNSRKRSIRRKRWEPMMMMKHEEASRRFGTDPSANNKVLPVIMEASVSDLETNHRGDAKGKTQKEQDRTKTTMISRMKELMRWTAAAKSDKAGNLKTSPKVLHLKSYETWKRKQLVKDNNFEQKTESSPKIKLRWEIENCSAAPSPSSSSSICSDIETSAFSSVRKGTEHATISLSSLYHCTARRGYWITTDSEFVVLEL